MRDAGSREGRDLVQVIPADAVDVPIERGTQSLATGDGDLEGRRVVVDTGMQVVRSHATWRAFAMH